ncbi:hypothetical protein [Polyangium jinanense]|uniref:Uncharacterized protein n=1 Tax=Polyangium jinanense TaxID=2829994 RepID=A0A9X3XG47_9BACT|nr:hypothetical protein [Polyangium jinanense]MDC3958216.1 hypothetical protein [Polyangium jinanense]MDC3988098.1 hypothetical protein [Polyangium jinanense]
MSDLMSENHLGPLFSSFLVDGVGTLGFLALFGAALLARARKRAEARAAEASFDGEKQLVVGEAMVFGKVERAEGSETTVRVEVDQHGEESESSGVWSHKWTEKSRRVMVAPFYLRLASGERVRVEPRDDVFLVDEMDGLVRVDLKSRMRYAELTPGERVYASGVLSRAPDPESQPGAGYRSGREGFVLRPPRSGRMLLSSQPLGERFHDRARFHERWAGWILLAAISFHVIFLGYHVRRWAGTDTTATISKLDHYVTKGDDTVTHHYRVWLTPRDGVSVDDEVEPEDFAWMHEGQIVPVRLVEGPFASTTTIGGHLTVHDLAWSVVPLLIGAWLIYRFRERATRPWYEREVVDSGSGKLEETFEAEKKRSQPRPQA